MPTWWQDYQGGSWDYPEDRFGCCDGSGCDECAAPRVEGPCVGEECPGCWACWDGDDETSWYEELNRGYSQDRI